MQVQPIAVYTNVYPNNKNSNSRNLNFKNYQQTFNKCFNTEIKKTEQVSQALTELMKELKTSTGLNINTKVIDLFEGLSNNFCNSIQKPTQFLHCINCNFPKGTNIADNEINKQLVYTDSNIIIFSDDKNEKHMEFGVDNEDLFKFSRTEPGFVQIHKFHPTGALKTKIEINGDNIFKASHIITHYDKNGKERNFRNLLSDIFGI